MADAVQTVVLFPATESTPTKGLIYQFINVSDGTGETAVVKIDKSILLTLANAEPSKITIDTIDWFVDGLRVDIYWDHNTDIKIASLTGHGFIDFGQYGGLQDTGTGGTGDIIFTTSNHSSGDSYMVIMKVRLET